MRKTPSAPAKSTISYNCPQKPSFHAQIKHFLYLSKKIPYVCLKKAHFPNEFSYIIIRKNNFPNKRISCPAHNTNYSEAFFLILVYFFVYSARFCQRDVYIVHAHIVTFFLFLL